MIGVATAPPAVITSHCQSEPQPSSGSWPPVSSSKTRQHRHGGAGGGAEDHLGERQLAQNQIAPQKNRKADDEQRQDADARADWPTSESNHSPPSTASNATVTTFVFKAA